MKQYTDLINGLNRYLTLYDEGLKKQANTYLKDFMDVFKKAVLQMETVRLNLLLKRLKPYY